jgi:hypothetical protein
MVSRKSPTRPTIRIRKDRHDGLEAFLGVAVASSASVWFVADVIGLLSNNVGPFFNMVSSMPLLFANFVAKQHSYGRNR